jgi:hypothetical protein
MKAFIKVSVRKYQFEKWKKATGFIFKPLGMGRIRETSVLEI